MRRIVLISCVSEKIDQKAQAQNLYVSDLFKKSLTYARSLQPDYIFILSAEYGLVELDREIEPYNKTLKKMPKIEIEHWAELVLSKLEKYTDINTDEFIFLAGEIYRKYLISHIKNYKIPMLGLGIGKQLKWLKEKNENK